MRRKESYTSMAHLGRLSGVATRVTGMQRSPGAE